MPQTLRIAIVGGGIGGLSAAAILSRHGTVDLYERGPTLGGKARQVRVGGREIDSGPTVFTMPWVFETVFERAGSALDRVVTRRPLDVLARHAWPDGGRLDLFADIANSAEAIAALSGPEDAASYVAFTERTRAIFETLKGPFLEAQAPDFLHLAIRRSPLSLLATAPFTPLWKALTRQFEDPRLRQLFGRYATYCGSSPFEAAATLMLVAHVEQDGVWALEGGMQAIVAALSAAAEANGARLHTGAAVTAILASGGRASGLRLESGEVVEADIVICNGDASALAEGLFGPDVKGAVRLDRSAPRSQSAVTWSAQGRLEGLTPEMHTVFFAGDYRAEFDAVFARGTVPDQPTTYICAPDRAPGAAPPEGLEPLFILINAPANGDRHSYSDEEIAACLTRMHETLARCGVTLTLSETAKPVATTPSDFAALFPATGGALYGRASHGWQASFRRPGVRSRVPGLYLAGGSVHPGPGVPMAALSGLAAAEAALKDCASTSLSRRRAMPGGISTRSVTTARTR